MANASKLKRKSSLGAPPPVEEASPNLEAPETAPATAMPAERSIGGWSRRRSNRTMQLNLKVTPEFDALLREIAGREGLFLAEVLEKALELYDKKLSI